MSSSIPINTTNLEEVVESFLGRMLAPGSTIAAPYPQRTFGTREWLWILVAGLAVGGATYIAILEAPWEHTEASTTVLPSGPTTHPPLPPSAATDAQVPNHPPGVVNPNPDLEKPPEIPGMNTNPAPVDPYDAILRKGWLFYKKGNYPAAAVQFNKAIQYDNHQTGGYYGLAVCLFEQGKEDKAIAVLDEGTQKVGSKDNLWVLAGSIYQWLGKERMARMAYERYLQANPKGFFATDLRAILKHPQLPRVAPFKDKSIQ